jgi:hypothetical protein
MAESTELAVVTTPYDRQVFVPRLDNLREPSTDNVRRIYTSLDVGDPTQKSQAVNAVMGQDARAEDVLGEVFAVRHYLCCDVRAINERSQKEESYIRTVLITDSGRMVSCGSAGVLNSLHTISAWYGQPPWTPSLNIEIRSQKGKQYDYYILYLRD